MDRSFRSEQWLNIFRSLEKDRSRVHQFGKKVFLGIFLGYALVAGGEAGREIFWLQTLRSWETLDASEIHALKTQCKRNNNV